MKDSKAYITHHADGSQSLTIQVSDCSVSLSSHCAKETGNFSIITFGGVTRENMMAIAGRIMAAVCDDRMSP